MQGRAGTLIKRLQGDLTYRAFSPNPLPPDPPLHFDDDILELNSEAERLIARLDAACELIPNPELFVFMYAKREAVLSSQIEGTQSSLDDVLRVEAKLMAKSSGDDVRETLNYLDAMNTGLELLKSLPVSLRLIKEVHRVLLTNVRGNDKSPGEFRRTQNWIGPAGATLNEAIFVPPPPDELLDHLGALENFIHSRRKMPPLVKAALVHAQFETIHPFIDGNGRLGRLLITFLLMDAGLLSQPLLYVSHSLKRNRSTYYERLQRVRTDGEWEQWVKFFLKSLAETALDANRRTKAILSLMAKTSERLTNPPSLSSARDIATVQAMYRSPYIQARQLATLHNVTFITAQSSLHRLEAAGIVREVTGGKRDRVYVLHKYLEILEKESFATEVRPKSQSNLFGTDSEF